MRLNGDGDTAKGVNQLVDLAVRILSIVANSAGCERLFSLFGIIHTKLRNRLGAEKVNQTATLKMELRREHAKEGLLSKRLKRRFGTQAQDESESNASETAANKDTTGPDVDAEELGAGDDEAEDIRGVISKLVKAVDEDDEGEGEEPSDDEDLPERVEIRNSPAPAAPRIKLFFGTKEPLTLAKIFDHSEKKHEHGLDFYWKGGIRNLEKEEELYELLANDGEGTSASTRAQNGSKDAPIEL